MNIISKPFKAKLSHLRGYISQDFTGVFGSSNETGSYTVAIDPKCLEQDLTQDTEVCGAFTIIQWNEDVPLSAGMKFNIMALTDFDSITFEEALSTLKDAVKRHEK